MPGLTDLEDLMLDDTHRNISHFEALPAELRHEILRYVLHTKQARLPKPERVTYPGKDKVIKSRSFDWHVPVLQVCRTLYNDGKDILYRENQWVKVHAQIYATQLFDSMISQDVPFIRHIAGITMTDHVMSVSLRWVPRTTEAEVPTSIFLLPAEEVSAFCSYLLMMRYCSISLFEYDINIPTKHAKSMQRRLLSPFAMLSEDLVVQNVQIQGQIQDSLANKVRLAMIQEIGWTRGRLWNVHRCIYGFAKLADQSFKEGDFAVATTKYRDVLEMWRRNNQYRPDIKLLDHHMCKTEWTLDMAVNINIWTCHLALGRVNVGMFAPSAAHVTQMLETAPQASMKAPRWLRCKYAHVIA